MCVCVYLLHTLLQIFTIRVVFLAFVNLAFAAQALFVSSFLVSFALPIWNDLYLRESIGLASVLARSYTTFAFSDSLLFHIHQNDLGVCFTNVGFFYFIHFLSVSFFHFVLLLPIRQ